MSDENQIYKFFNGLTQAIGFDGMFGRGKAVQQTDTLVATLRNNLITNFRHTLAQAYAEIGLIQTITDIPVDDALRGGIDISSNELNEDDIKSLQNEMDRKDDMWCISQALKWNRLFGGSAIIILTENSAPDQPLTDKEIKKGEDIEFLSVDLWELYNGSYNEKEGDDLKTYNRKEVATYRFYNQTIDASRVIKFTGIEPPSFIRPRLKGWGLSVVESLIGGINQYLKSNNLAFEVLDEFKIDIFRIKNLATTLLSPGGDAKIRQRVQLANQEKNFKHAITLDSEDEYQQKQLSFSGVSEAMDGIRKQIASDMRMPMTKLFGISSAGFNSGEDDIENYNGMIESSIRTPYKNDILRIVKIRCMQLFGFIPEDLTIDFKPLRVMSGEQEENIKTQKFNRLLQAYQAGLIDTKEFREACNSDKLFAIRLQNDNDIEMSLSVKEISDGKYENPELENIELLETKKKESA